jgi:hypothetical protein
MRAPRILLAKRGKKARALPGERKRKGKRKRKRKGKRKGERKGKRKGKRKKPAPPPPGSPHSKKRRLISGAARTIEFLTSTP